MKLLMLTFLALPLSALAETSTYKIDPGHTSIVFKINHMGFSNVYGMIHGADGKIVVDDKAPEKSSFDVSAKLETIHTGSPQRDEHLKKADFFSINQFPNITLKSKSVKKNGDNYEISADLTLHGVTKTVPLTFKLNKIGKGPKGETRMGGDTVLKIKRTEYGMNYMSKPGEVGDDVEIMVSLEAVKS